MEPKLSLVIQQDEGHPDTHLPMRSSPRSCWSTLWSPITWQRKEDVRRRMFR